MLQYSTVLPHTLELLKSITDILSVHNYRLVGGTALALQYGHRTSVDLDFFGGAHIDADDLLNLFNSLGETSMVGKSSVMAFYFIDGVKIDVVCYPYEWIDGPVTDKSICLASPVDIAAMKLNAITGRGSRKDFVDLYFLLQHYSLSELLEFYHRKYQGAEEFLVLKSLNYFVDAEAQPMPRMLVDVEWEEIKRHITEQAIALL
ncbi:MAG: nucleotidyl transferase AbiEii/AbiGii toxin family protein [Muribaculaceae bacterium]|nr:nucleotidyl transferase AbiEii/AbiGii toxin family protein [Muribaculaceae bacterium]